MEQKEVKYRKQLTVTNSCAMKNCQYYKKEMCTHERNTVNRLGQDACPLIDGAIDREFFTG